MYTIYLDDVIFCTPQAEELAIIDPVITLERNQPGTLTFTLPSTHPRYNDIHERTSIFEVYRDTDDEPVFSGVCMSKEVDYYNQMSVSCEGELGFFNDSIQRPARYQGYGVRQLLEAYVDHHNEQVDDFKRFEVGEVTVTDENDYIYCYTNNQTTMEELKEDLVDDLGGYFRVRHKDGKRILDYLAEPVGVSSQEIRLGENLIDFNTNLDMSDIATVIIPLGATLEESAVEGLDTRLTIESVNDGKDYIEGDAVETYGRITKVVEYDDVTIPSNLLAKGKKYLEDAQFADLTIEARAIDLSNIDGSTEPIRLNWQSRVVSKAHGLNKVMTVTRQTLNLWNPEKDEVELGADEQETLSAKTSATYRQLASAIDNITPASTILKKAYDNATEIMQEANGGTVDKTRHDITIYNGNNEDDSTYGWRWNTGGFFHISRENVTDEWTVSKVAIQMTGEIVADFITAGVLKGVQIRTTDNEVNISDNNGIVANRGKIGAWNISRETATEGALYSDKTIDGTNWRVWINQAQASDDTWIFSIQKQTSETTYARTFKVEQNGNISTVGNIATNGAITAGGDIQATNANVICNRIQAHVDITSNGAIAAVGDISTSGKVYANNDGAGLRQCVTSSSDGTVLIPDSSGIGVYINNVYAGHLLYI
jgi:hypothetical protein